MLESSKIIIKLHKQRMLPDAESCKADLFNDPATKKDVMSTDDPVQQKYLGKQVNNYKADTWKEKAPEIMVRGLEAKFTQNEELKMRLISTGDKTIIEATKDTFWGIGLPLNSKDIFNKTHYSGNNILGKTLMAVRDKLM